MDSKTMFRMLLDEYPTHAVDRFVSFHEKNLFLYDEFKRISREMRATGRTRYSGRTIFEVLRWRQDIKTRGDTFKINDDYVPMYVRLLIHECPEFATFFELRRVRSRGIATADGKWGLNERRD